MDITGYAPVDSIITRARNAGEVGTCAHEEFQEITNNPHTSPALAAASGILSASALPAVFASVARGPQHVDHLLDALIVTAMAVGFATGQAEAARAMEQVTDDQTLYPPF